MKICPKCGNEHEKNGVYCSRSCANSRVWSDIDKYKMSISAKNSLKVINANTDLKKRQNISEKAKKQAKEGRINWSGLHTPDVINKVKLTIKNKQNQWLNTLNNENKIEYRKSCKFRFSLNDFPNEFEFNLINEYGWYKAKNKGDNLNGISRDHMYSINEGFKNLVDPYYISHPANCQLMRHGDNNKKDRKCSITLDELIDKVQKWDKKYGGIV